VLEGSGFERASKNGENVEEQGIPDVFSIDPHAIGELERFSYLAALEKKDTLSGNALPVVSFINPLFYNIDLLQAAGFDRPPKNRTEFLSYAQRLKETGVSGAGLALGDPRDTGTQLLSWIWPAAGSPESAETFSFNSKEVIGTLNFLKQLKQSLYSDPFELNGPELLDAFAQGKVGMMIGSSADVKKLKAAEINFGITTIPDPESYVKKPIFPLTVWYAGINSRSAHKEEARKFIAFLKKKTENIALTTYALPISGSRDRTLSKNDPYYAKAFDMYEASEMVRELYVPDIGGFYGIVHREAALLFLENKTPEQCAETIQQGWERLAGTGMP
jgi:multiple sugar transport system substrate-binding protein